MSNHLNGRDDNAVASRLAEAQAWVAGIRDLHKRASKLTQQFVKDFLIQHNFRQFNLSIEMKQELLLLFSRTIAAIVCNAISVG